MKKLLLSAALPLLLLGNFCHAQNSEKIKAYIETYKDIAIAEMQRTGVPAAIKLAQGIHETGAGTSNLVLRSNNHFGIKCKTEWKGESVRHDDDARNECFRKYNDAYESYRDHSDFLKYRPYYQALFKLDPTDYEGWAYGLKKAGYATNPKYPQILIKLIRDYNLQEYTLIALNKKPAEENLVFASAGNAEPASEAAPVEEVETINLKNIYPASVFRINETRVVVVEKGTSFLKVASENKLDLTRLFDFNDLDPADIADKDQLVFLQRKRKTGEEEFHIVAPGETLHDIAQKRGIRLQSLLELNHLEKNMMPAAGEKLFLKTKAAARPLLKEENMGLAKTGTKSGLHMQGPEPGWILHSVQSKETLYAISKKYGVEVEEILQWNEIQSSELRIGQQLRILKRN